MPPKAPNSESIIAVGSIAEEFSFSSSFLPVRQRQFVDIRSESFYALPPVVRYTSPVPTVVFSRVLDSADSLYYSYPRYSAQQHPATSYHGHTRHVSSIWPPDTELQSAHSKCTFQVTDYSSVTLFIITYTYIHIYIRILCYIDLVGWEKIFIFL